MNEALSEKEILEGCMQGHPKAQRLLFNKLYPKMLGLCKRYAANEDEAKDMLQDGFIKVFDNLHKYRGESSLQTWVSRVMINNAINQLKKQQRTQMSSLQPTDEFDIAETDEDVAGEIEQAEPEAIIELIRKLPAGYRTILNLYAIEGYTHKQIGEMLGIAEGTSKSQLSKARILLKQELSKIKRNA
jgi:RNA polymerase sigma factor (sigma-70 family)